MNLVDKTEIAGVYNIPRILNIFLHVSGELFWNLVLQDDVTNITQKTMLKTGKTKDSHH